MIHCMSNNQSVWPYIQVLEREGGRERRREGGRGGEKEGEGERRRERRRGKRGGKSLLYVCQCRQNMV